jgi:hypothetical protein
MAAAGDASYNAPMPRPCLQFRLSTLLWFTLAVACWLGGMRFQSYRQLMETRRWEISLPGPAVHQKRQMSKAQQAEISVEDYKVRRRAAKPPASSSSKSGTPAKESGSD